MTLKINSKMPQRKVFKNDFDQDFNDNSQDSFTKHAFKKRKFSHSEAEPFTNKKQALPIRKLHTVLV